ncbi:RICIN domain-containing protein [Streptomyces sp. 058-1L]|uniref:RICIN domain-containing protein n=1 Tax=Streptomyces sp. 058-1L TaxID=2789266 RepID=UPI00397FF841
MDETTSYSPIGVHRVAAAMPDVPTLQERAKALAVISTITATEWCWGYSYSASRCPGGGGWVVQVPNVGERSLDIHFHGDAGTLVFSWDIDADMQDIAEEILEQVPETLRHCLWHGNAEFDDHSMCDGLPSVSALMWRFPKDAAWNTAEFTPDEESVNEGDCAEFVLVDLIAPVPGTVMMTDGLGVERASSAITAAIGHILAGRPLSEDVVRSLDPERSLADVADAVAAIGYPAAQEPETILASDRRAGQGFALVVADIAEPWHTSYFFLAPDREGFHAQPWSARHFLLEPDREGFHRILVHHSSTALEAAGTTVGSAVTQNELHDGDSQKWLLQKFQDGAFRDCAQVPGFAPDDVEAPSDWAEYRIVAKQSGLALQAAPGPGAQPVVLAHPHDGDDQIFGRSGYGYWDFLTARGSSRQLMIRY